VARAPKARPTRVGFIGAGGISSKHAESLKLIPAVELVAICDVVPARAQALAGQFGVAQVFSSMEEMFRKAELDVIHVLTPPQYHVEVALECLREGRHVLVEKPLGLSATDCERLRTESQRKGLLCGVNHNMTHVPVVDRLVDVVRSRKLGRVNHLMMNACFPPGFIPLSDLRNFMFRDPTSMIYEFGPHPFSIVHRFMGRVLDAQCLASGERKLPGERSIFESWQIALICQRGTASLCFIIGKGVADSSIRLLGEDGIAHADLDSGAVRLFENSPFPNTKQLRQACSHSKECIGAALKKTWHSYGATVSPLSDHARLDPFVRSLFSFYQALFAKTTPREDVSSGIAVVEYCEETAGSVKFASADKETIAHVAS